MKQVTLFIGTILMSALCFANPQTSLSKNSPQLNALGSAWKTAQSTHAIEGTNDITMVYGGADISRKPTLVFHSATA